MENHGVGLADAYQLAAHEMERVQRLPWDDLSPCQDAPWRFADGDLRDLAEARGGVTIEDAYDGNPGVKQVTVALEWRHIRHGRRTVRLITLVSKR